MARELCDCGSGLEDWLCDACDWDSKPLTAAELDDGDRADGLGKGGEDDV